MKGHEDDGFGTFLARRSGAVAAVIIDSGKKKKRKKANVKNGSFSDGDLQPFFAFKRKGTVTR